MTALDHLKALLLAEHLESGHNNTATAPALAFLKEQGWTLGQIPGGTYEWRETP
jgi:hypothetical protein